MIVLLGIFSPHRFLGNTRLLASVMPLHAKLLEFLRQYLEGSYWKGPLCNQNFNYKITNTEYDNVARYESISQQIHTGFLTKPNLLDTFSNSTMCSFSNYRSTPSLVPTINIAAHCWRVCTRRPPTPTITPDFEACSMFGTHLPGLAALTQEQRDRLKSMIVNVRIHDQVDWQMLEAFGFGATQFSSPRAQALEGSGSSACAHMSTELEANWRWRFVFCVTALNDPRMSEVTLPDRDVRWALSQQYTPLMNELPATTPTNLSTMSHSETSSFSSV